MAILSAEYKFSGKRAVLRNAEPDDARALVLLAGRLGGQTDFLPGGLNWGSMTEAQAQTEIASRRDAQGALLAVAEVAGRIVAVCEALLDPRDGHNHIGRIALAVEAAHWNVSIGRALMEEGIAWLTRNGAEKINLCADTANIRAITLYQHLGFAVEGRQERARRLPDGTYRDAYWMGLKR